MRKRVNLVQDLYDISNVFEEFYGLAKRLESERIALDLDNARFIRSMAKSCRNLSLFAEHLQSRLNEEFGLE